MSIVKLAAVALSSDKDSRIFVFPNEYNANAAKYLAKQSVNNKADMIGIKQMSKHMGIGTGLGLIGALASHKIKPNALSFKNYKEAAKMGSMAGWLVSVPSSLVGSYHKKKQFTNSDKPNKLYYDTLANLSSYSYSK